MASAANTKEENYINFINETSYLANKFEETGHLKRAMQCYMLCVRFLGRLKSNPDRTIGSDEIATINERIVEYQNHVERLAMLNDENSKKLCKVTLVGNKKQAI
ncbi:ORF147 [Leucania separata nucleopolyhedrovirus]|uniref:ORF147 n=1 Tax=Leucania separata nucleopolyhedrovirus TaxID=1307956 RepID=Q0IKX2_NPVLS|nr:ORF147 [Leucania separata nucleopolyhedrovirus]AAR28911.1 ORF147 [Leucania separata nucleopolyhedrovirus]